MSSSFLLRRVGSLAASAIIFSSIAHATGTYNLQVSWEGQNILDHFNFFDQADPTNGFVTYVNQSYAEDSGLVKTTDSGSLYLGVDYDTVLTADGPGRDSVRIESNEYFDQGLYVFDIQHMPGSICGTWPAFWAVGPEWPYDGEIDIIEGVNMHDSNKIVLHTSGSCDVGGDFEMSGELTSSECGEASGTIGCVVEGQQGSSGTPFNKQGGGVYAMEWQPEYLKIWFFPRPDTSEFGTPMAHLQGGCNFEERFTHQKLILDTTFCGEWAGNVYGDSGCPLSDASDPMQSCINYVAENPAVFKQAYWELNSIKIYQTGGTSISSTETATSVEPETATHSTETNTATEETLLPTTSTTTATRTETSTPSHSITEPTTTTEPTIEPTTTPTTAPSAPTESTSYVTITTTLCPIASIQTANEPVPETTATPTPQPSTTTESAVDAPAPPETMATSSTDVPSSPPDSIIYTAPDSSPSFVTVPTAASQSPVFTGVASKLSASASVIVGALVMILLA
ncbi:concanavalin A-like lectin/glucanase domain-containing protein [Aspergillus cavernicola]|uniref:endo-1,3(4)-beta-glucanase n=1 Tax=Aspergillus cavernicola TaxID=176166 RepID=A0ABR4HDK5_9EURO